MSVFLASDVRVQEEEPPIGTLPELDSAVPAFVGLTERGVLTPVEVSSWDDYVQNFGTYSITAGGTSGVVAQVPLAVRQFFLNGGRKAVILRRLQAAPVTATHTFKDVNGTPADTLQIDASSAGIWGNSLSVEITAATSGVATEFDIIVTKNSVVVENWPNLSMVTTYANYVETVINDPNTGSIYIVATDKDSASTPPADMPAVIAATALTTGVEGAAASMVLADYTGDDDFADLEEAEITMLAVPDASLDDTLTADVQESMIVFCEVTRTFGVFAIFDTIVDQDEDDARTQFNALTATECGAAYWPQVKIPNPNKSIFGSADLITIPPCGPVCGVCARNDGDKKEGPFAQPAGVYDGRLLGVVDLESDTVQKKSVRNEVYPDRINPIRYKKNYGIFIDGSRTKKGTGNFPSVGERRGASHIETTLKDGLEWVRHQGNTEELRGKIERTVRGFLLDYTNNGAFASKDPDQAFIVDADIPGVGINNARVRAQNKVYVRVGIATAKPAEYVIILVSQDTRALNEATLGKQS